jgi:small subunit ribosomal protein S17
MKALLGTVISTKMQQTVVVSVERRWRHPLYKKIIKRNKKYLAHDALGVKTGDKVYIKETKPISKNKRFKVIKKLEKPATAKVKKIRKKIGKQNS